jgi:hypothetical protein
MAMKACVLNPKSNIAMLAAGTHSQVKLRPLLLMPLDGFHFRKESLQQAHVSNRKAK